MPTVVLVSVESVDAVCANGVDELNGVVNEFEKAENASVSVLETAAAAVPMVLLVRAGRDVVGDVGNDVAVLVVVVEFVAFTIVCAPWFRASRMDVRPVVSEEVVVGDRLATGVPTTGVPMGVPMTGVSRPPPMDGRPPSTGNCSRRRAAGAEPDEPSGSAVLLAVLVRLPSVCMMLYSLSPLTTALGSVATEFVPTTVHE